MPFLPLEIQELLFLAEDTIFIFAMVLNFVAISFLIKQTPPNQATFRNYLIFIQVFVILTDVVYGLSQPMPLFPLWAGYCCGWLCRNGLSTNNVMGLVTFALSNVGVASFMCCIYRQQTLLFDSDPFKLGKRTLAWNRLIIFTFFNVGPILLMMRTVDYETVEILVDQYDLGWIRGRSSNYIAEQLNPQTGFFLYMVIAVLFFVTLSVFALFGHMYFVLHQQRSNHSIKNDSVVRKSLTILFVQLAIPYMLIIVPATVIFLGLAIPEQITFELSLAMFYVIHLHSVGHNLILLSITSTYRKAIIQFVRCSIMRTPSVVHSTTALH